MVLLLFTLPLLQLPLLPLPVPYPLDASHVKTKVERKGSGGGGGIDSLLLIFLFLSHSLTIPPHPQPPPFPELNVKDLVNASSTYPLPLYVCNANIFLKHGWSLSPSPSFPIQSPSTATMTEGQGDEQRDNPCLNGIFTNFFTLTLYTKRWRGQRGMGKGRSQPFLWYICQFLHHIKLLNSEEQVGEMEGSNPPPPPHKSVVTSPYPSNSASASLLCKMS